MGAADYVVTLDPRAGAEFVLPALAIREAGDVATLDHQALAGLLIRHRYILQGKSRDVWVAIAGEYIQTVGKGAGDSHGRALVDNVPRELVGGVEV